MVDIKVFQNEYGKSPWVCLNGFKFKLTNQLIAGKKFRFRIGKVSNSNQQNNVKWSGDPPARNISEPEFRLDLFKQTRGNFGGWHLYLSITAIDSFPGDCVQAAATEATLPCQFDKTIVEKLLSRPIQRWWTDPSPRSHWVQTGLQITVVRTVILNPDINQ